MIQGASNREIADILCLTEGTVKNYISSIYGKFGINDRLQVIDRLRGLLSDE
jgi:DNA-binding NarL/FixJ family response regulator